MALTFAAPIPPDGEAWDVVVVGTGLGGATLGHALAARGHSVLFLEMGAGEFSSDASVAEEVEDPAARLAAAHWPARMAARVDGETSAVFPALGCGAGGSSLLYAAALERFERGDVESLSGRPHPTGGWPIRWAELSDYYTAAEQLYRVVGTKDPLADTSDTGIRPPPRASAVDQEMASDFQDAGLHPYRLHVGLGYRPGCVECGGHICPHRCKSDARTICLDPAVRQHGATLLTESEVIRIDATRHEATGVTYLHGGSQYRARGRFIVLAAGAYRSPALLLRSKSALWPNGLANSSGQVGRNLMFHANEWFAIWPRRPAATMGPRKTIGLRDLYHHEGLRLGSIQSTGLSGHAGNIHAFLRNWFDMGPLRRLRFLRPCLWLAARIGQRLFGAATIFVMIVEDLGYADNRVVLDPEQPDRIRIEYQVRAELRQRTRTARALVRKAMRGLRVMPLQNDVQLNFGHACGTCRAGDDPGTSVVDGTCRAHDLGNLYVVDASFMPSSGGTNPGLTVIANALRVADVLNDRLDFVRRLWDVSLARQRDGDQIEQDRA